MFQGFSGVENPNLRLSRTDLNAVMVNQEGGPYSDRSYSATTSCECTIVSSHSQVFSHSG